MLEGRYAMLSIKKILLPIDYPLATLRVIHQAATLARRFQSEIMLLHVATPQSRAAGVQADGNKLADWNLLAAILQQAEELKDTSLRPELEVITVHQSVIEGDAAGAIARIAEKEKIDLIMMPSHGFTFDQFLQGSVTAGVKHETECPVWTCAQVEKSEATEFAIHNVLGAVEFGARCDLVVSWAAQISAEFRARLTLAHVTARLESWGPGGSIVDKDWEKEIVTSATEQMADLQLKMGTKADVFIGSGDVPKVLGQAAKQTKADLLVAGCYPYGVHLRTRGYGIMCALPIPVLNV